MAAVDALPWVCPAIVEAADAWPLYDDQGTMAAGAGGRVLGAILDWQDPSCPEVDCSTPELACVEVSCVTKAGASWYSRERETVDTGQYYAPLGTTLEWVVSPPPGEATWSEARITRVRSHTRKYDGETSGETQSASWVGTIVDDLPADGWFESDHSDTRTDAFAEQWGWASEGCSWDAMEWHDEPSGIWVGEQLVQIETPACEGRDDVVFATIDQVPAGVVTREGWVKVAEDCEDLFDTGGGDTGHGGAPASSGCGCSSGVGAATSGAPETLAAPMILAALGVRRRRP